MNSRHVPPPVPSSVPSHSTDSGISRRLIRGFAGLLAVVLLSALFASACGTSSTVSPSMTTSRAASATAAATTAAAGYNKGGSPVTTTVPPGYPTATTVPSSGSRPSEYDVKIIRNAALELESKDAEQAYRNLLAFAAGRGGYEASYRLTTSTGRTVVDASIKLPPKYLDEFLNYAGTAAKVISATTTSQDVTESYYDVQTRLNTLQQMLAKYAEFLNKATTVNEALSVQSEINRLTTEIESLKGKLRYYDSVVAESTIVLSIRQEQTPVTTTEDIHWNALTLADMGRLMQRGFMTVINSLTSILQWIAIALVSVAPLLVIALVVLLIIRFRRRRHPRPPHESDRGGRGGYGGPAPSAGAGSGFGASGAAGPAGSGSPSNRVVPVEHWGRTAKARADQQKTDTPQPAPPGTPPETPGTPQPEMPEPAAPVPSNGPQPAAPGTPQPELPEPAAPVPSNGAAPLEIPDRSESEPADSTERSR